jgi:PadR family transcriptional regulator PadR
MITRALATASLKPVVLSILNNGDSYGYQIIRKIQTLSEGELQWTTGTLYPFLHSLEIDGDVMAYWQEVDKAPRRKYYRLTPKGQKALLQEQKQWMNVNRMLVKLWGPSAELSWT